MGPQNKTHKRRRRDRRAPGRRGNDRSARGCLRRTWRRPLRQARGNKIDITIPLMARARVSPRQRERTLLGRLAQNLSDTSPHHRATFSNVAPSLLALDVTPPCQDNGQGGCTRRTGIIPVTRPGKSGGRCPCTTTTGSSLDYRGLDEGEAAVAHLSWITLRRHSAAAGWADLAGGVLVFITYPN